MIDPAHHQNTPAGKLFARRPDLQYLPLTCDNTNTPIPTIDLVNEILEINVAAAFQIPVNVRSYDSTGISADVLRAVPQNVIDAVYDPPSGPCLANQVYPFALPFHRPLAVVRTYLDRLGATYRDVYASFGPLGPADLTRDEHLAAEDLGLSVFQFQTIATATTGNALAAAYGYTADSSATWIDLAVVPTLLARTGVNYDDLYAISWTFFLSPAAPATRPRLQDPVQCQIDNTSLLGATPDTWDRLHRFIRLRLTTPWSIADPDRVLYALGAHDPQSHAITLDHVTLRQIGEARRAIAALGQRRSRRRCRCGRIRYLGRRLAVLARFATRRSRDRGGSAFDLASYDPNNPAVSRSPARTSSRALPTS